MKNNHQLFAVINYVMLSILMCKNYSEDTIAFPLYFLLYLIATIMTCVPFMKDVATVRLSKISWWEILPTLSSITACWFIFYLDSKDVFHFKEIAHLNIIGIYILSIIVSYIMYCMMYKLIKFIKADSNPPTESSITNQWDHLNETELHVQLQHYLKIEDYHTVEKIKQLLDKKFP